MHNYNKIKSKQDIFDVDWNLGTICNYSCSYCIPHLHSGEQEFVYIEKAVKFVEKLLDQYPDKLFNFILSGGEVTLWKDLPKLLKTIKNNSLTNVQLITNGSPSPQWWKTNSIFIDSVILSYHWEYANKNRLKEICRILDENKCNIKLTILALPDKLDECYKLADEFLSYIKMKIELRIIKKPNNEPIDEYTEEQLQQLRNNNVFGRVNHKSIDKRLITDTGKVLDAIVELSQQKNSWKGWRCYIGLNCLKIDWKGDIYRAACSCQQENKLGNINEEDYNFPNRPVICDKDFCFCVTDIRATKERIKENR